MKNLALFLISLWCFIPRLVGQELSSKEAKVILAKISLNYTSPHYAMTYTKKMYQSTEFTEPYEVSSGTFRFGENHQYRAEEPGMLVVQNDQINLALDSTDNKVYASKTEIDIVPLQLDQLESDSVIAHLKFTLAKGKTSLELKVENRADLANHYILTLDPKTHRLIRFEYHFEQGNYFSEEMDDETLERPYMIIEYTSYVKEKQAYSYFDPLQWISSYDLPLKLNPSVRGFEIRDSRPESYK